MNIVELGSDLVREIKTSKTRMSLLMIGMTTFVSAGAAMAAQGNPGIAPIKSNINYVKTYGQLGAEWDQWAFQAPTADNPVVDLTGEKCRVGQQGPVWFLAGVFGSTGPTAPVVRTCEVPGGKAFFFPVLNTGYSAFLNDPPETRTEAYIRAAGSNCDKDSIQNLSVMIDDVPVAKPGQFWIGAEATPLFEMQLPTDNVYGATTADIPQLLLSPSVQEGIYIYVEPLKTGPHTIAWTGSWNCGGATNYQNIQYNLNILSGVPGLVQ